MARFEVFIPATEPEGMNLTLRVTADTWMAALKVGLKKIGGGGSLPQNVLCDIQDDESIHVTDPRSNRVFRIVQIPEISNPGLEPTGPTAPWMAPPSDAPPPADTQPQGFRVDDPKLKEALAAQERAVAEAHRSQEARAAAAAKFAVESRAAGERAAQGKVLAERAAGERAAAEARANAEARTAAGKAAFAERLSAEKAAFAERLSAEARAAAQKAAAEARAAQEARAAAERAAQDRLSAERSAAERAERERAQVEKAAAERAAAELLAAEKAAADRKRVEEATAGRIAAEKEAARRAAEGVAHAAAPPNPAVDQAARTNPELLPVRKGKGKPALVKVVEVEKPRRPPPGQIGRFDAGPSGREAGNREVEEILCDLFERTPAVFQQEQKAALYFLLDLAMEKIPSDSGTVYVADLNTHDLHFAAVRGPKAQELIQLDARVPMGRGFVGFSAQEGVAVAISDAQRDKRFFKEISERIGYETKSVLVTPILVGGRTLGAIQLINKQGSSSFTSAELSILHYLAHQAGLYLDSRDA